MRYNILSADAWGAECSVHVSLTYAATPTPGMYLVDELDNLFVVRGLKLVNYEPGKCCTLIVRGVSDPNGVRVRTPVGSLGTTYRRS